EPMKTRTLAATILGGVILVGGGVAGTVALTGETEAAPAVTETPEPSVEPTEAVETPDVEPAPEETVAPEYSEAEQVFLDWARPIYEFNRSDAPRLPEMSDDDMLEALYKACEIGGDPNTGISVIPGFETADDFNV